MASVTKNDGKNAMADEAESKGPLKKLPSSGSGGIRPPKYEAPPKSPAGGGAKVVGGEGGFFTIYKKGQGYWTRIGTVAAAALIAALTCNFLYGSGKIWFQSKDVINFSMVYGTIFAFLAIFSFFVYRTINKPRVVDFLIATDSEMKKVNWTTRAELIGSTKVVIIFMFLIGLLLFLFDIFFGFVFGKHMLHILESPL